VPCGFFASIGSSLPIIVCLERTVGLSDPLTAVELPLSPTALSTETGKLREGSPSLKQDIHTNRKDKGETIMNSWQNKLVVEAHHEALYKEAEQARLAQEAQDNKRQNHANPALAALGRLLVDAGSRLQENYGEDLKVERQHA
jgi:hypothetical protein